MPLHVGAENRPEHADGRKGADAGDVIDRAKGVLDRLDTRDDLPRDRSLAELPRRVLECVEERLLSERLFLARKVPGKVVRIVELVAELEVVDAQIDQAIVLGEVPGGHELKSDQRADALLDRTDVWSGLFMAALRVAAIEVNEGHT